MIRAAAIVFSSAGRPADAGDWAFERLAGLAHVERLLASVGRAGMEEVALIADSSLAARLSSWIESSPRARAIRTSVAGGIGSLAFGSGGPVLVVDGRRLYDPAWISDLAHRAEVHEQVDSDGRASGLRVAPGDAALAEEWADFERTLPGVPARLAPGGAWSARVDTGAGRRRARDLLMTSLAKPTDGWCSRHLNRPISTRLSIRLAPLGVHPDLVTAVTFGVAIAAALFAARGTWAGFALGGLLFQIASLLDGVDGELARLRFASSARGQWLDTVCDDLSNVLYLGGVTVGVARAGYPAWMVEAGLAAIALDLLTVGIMYWQLLARGEEGTLLAFQGVIDRPAFGHGLAARLARRLHPFVKRDMYAYVFMVAAFAGAPWLPLVTTPVALLFTLAGFARILLVLRGSEA